MFNYALGIVFPFFSSLVCEPPWAEAEVLHSTSHTT